MSVQADQLNAKIRQLGYRWHARETSVSRLSKEDKRRLTGILISREEALERRKFYDQQKANARSEGETCVYPSSWDWRDVNGHDYTTPAKSQQPCPACSVFAGLAVIESTYMIAWKRRGSIFLPPGMYPWWKPDKPKPCPSYDLSEADLWFCGNVGNCDHTQVCEKGWTLEDMLTWVLLNGAVCESTYAWSPSTTNRNQCPIADRSSQRATRISDFRLLTTDCQAKEWIASYGPVLTCMIPYEDFGYYSGEEVYTPVLDDGQNAYGPMGVHAVCLVGYNESGKYWIGKNSWGQDWGEKGFFKVGYEGLCEVGRCIGGYYGVGVKIPPLFIRRDRLPWIRRIIDVLPKESQFE